MWVLRRPFDFAQGCSGRQIRFEGFPRLSVILSERSESKNPYLFRIVGEADTIIVHCPLSIVNSVSQPGIGAAHRPPPTGKSVLRMEFGGRVKTLPYRAVTIPGGAPRSESEINMLAGGKHTYTNQGKAVTIS